MKRISISKTPDQILKTRTGNKLPFSRIQLAALVVTMLVLSGQVRGQQVFDWSNTANTNAFYDLPENWLQNGMPGPNDHALFGSPDTYQVWWDNITAGVTPAVGLMQVASGDVTFLNNGGGNQHLFTIHGSGGSGAFSDFSISGAGTSLINRGLHLNSLSGGQIVDGATLTLDGSHAQGARLTVSGNTGFDVSGDLNVQSGAIFDNTVGHIGRSANSTGAATVTGFGSRWNSQNLYLGGTATADGGVGTLTISDSGSVHIGNSIWLPNGRQDSLSIGDTGDNGNLWVRNGSTINTDSTLLGGNPGSTGVATVTGSGSQITVLIETIVGWEGNGTLNIQDGGFVSNRGWSILARNSSSIGMATVTGSGSHWNTSDVLIVGEGGNATLNVAAGGLVSSNSRGFISGSIGRVAGSMGTVTVTGTGSQWTNQGNLYIGGHEFGAGGTGTLTIADGGLVSITGTTKLWSSGSLALNTGGIFDTQILDLTAGSLDMRDGGILHATEVLGDLTNESGILAPGHSPGVTTIFGNYVQGANAALQIELGGSTTGLFDQLFVTGDLFLDGYLDLQLQNGFSPDANQQFLIVDVGGMLTGQFSGLGEGDLVGSFAGRDFFVSYAAGDGNDIALFTSVPEPGSLVLAIAGLSMAAGTRRRKAVLSA